uniref:Uncharacterized protein n=1 Tax=Chromera velia CCMP2878 TaxID=1169474 RepID=A0A0G4G750_9ALVE|eukprot:Cvel_20582.t1-p1 / transcript=Cvel_20582.t1 / gene=Cvel_20582 / organism=Chromera_velia_CCMP2878 / gene_product=Ubiquitin fusion degradation protein 1 homolog, putative / transcript_product=Ubiquitin fusion degradation protein 1 homolog, putative / location=Cvel_scaffold1859:17100-21942(-) / protein_length=397 / sequence_SO=supercontig / SO=protein_coding / is_pseudo=false
MFGLPRLFGGGGGGGGPDHPAFGGGGGGPGRFDVRLSCYPVSFLGKDELEKGNKIILPNSALDQLARLNITWPMMFEIQNQQHGRTTHSGVMEFIAEEGTCNMPYWLMQHLLLKEGDIVRIRNTTLPKGTYVKLQPVKKEFLDISNPRAVLEQCLRNFATLQVGDEIVIQHGLKSYEIEIVEAKPARAVCIIETDVQVDFAPPKDYVEPERPAHPAAAAAAAAAAASGAGSSSSGAAAAAAAAGSGGGTETEEPPAKAQALVFTGSGQRLDGKPVRNPKPPVPASPLDHEKKPAGEKVKLTEEEELGDEPWNSRLRLPGGVRTSDTDYDAMALEGRVPGVLGTGQARAIPNQQAGAQQSAGAGQGGGAAAAARAEARARAAAAAERRFGGGGAGAGR